MRVLLVGHRTYDIDPVARAVEAAFPNATVDLVYRDSQFWSQLWHRPPDVIMSTGLMRRPADEEVFEFQAPQAEARRRGIPFVNLSAGTRRKGLHFGTTRRLHLPTVSIGYRGNWSRISPAQAVEKLRTVAPKDR